LWRPHCIKGPAQRTPKKGEAIILAAKVLTLGCAALAVALAPSRAFAQSDEADLMSMSVHINRSPQQPWPGYGVYLGAGLVLTAAHVPGNVAETKPHVVIAGEDLPASLVKQGRLEGVDLTLLSIDATKLPVRLRMRRTPLCERESYAGEPVVVATPEGTARSSVLALQEIPAELRGRFGTAIAYVAATGNSGSGVFDAANQCLLGIISRKISVIQQESKLGAPVRTTKDIAKYFVPAPDIKAFIPESVSF
jgi:Trypsin-like peptidase domain